MPARTPTSPSKKPARPSKTGGGPRKPPSRPAKPGGKAPKPAGRAPKPARSGEKPTRSSDKSTRSDKPGRGADKPGRGADKPARGRRTGARTDEVSPEARGRRAGRGRPAGEGPAEGRPGDRGPRTRTDVDRASAHRSPGGASPPGASEGRIAREPPRPNLGEWDADVDELGEQANDRRGARDASDEEDIFGWSDALDDEDAADDDEAPTRHRPPARITGGRARKTPSAQAGGDDTRTEARPRRSAKPAGGDDTRTEARPSRSAKPAGAAKPAAGAKPATGGAKPAGGDETRTGRSAKPVAGAKPATGAAKPAAGTKPATGAARPAAGAKPAAGTKPATGAKPARPAPEGPQLSVFPNPRVRLRIVHADPAFLVVHKPAGLVTQPGEGHARDTLLNGLFVTHGTILQNIGRPRDFGLLHRLDRATSGLVLVALTAEAYDHMRKQFADRVVKKTYVALVHGAPHPPEGTERTQIYESRDQGRKRAKLGEHSTAQPAVTKYKTLVRSKGLSLVECHPETGRLHQIRVHMAHRGCPVIADDDYGFAGWDSVDHTFAKLTGRAQFLHAAEISFVHPTSGKRVSFSEPLPTAWVEFLATHGITCPNKYRGAVP